MLYMINPLDRVYHAIDIALIVARGAQRVSGRKPESLLWHMDSILYQKDVYLVQVDVTPLVKHARSPTFGKISRRASRTQ